MTSVLVVDPDTEQRTQLEKELKESNQFGVINACKDLACASRVIDKHRVEVLLLAESLTEHAVNLEEFKQRHPKIGLVVVSDKGALSDIEQLKKLGVHAQTSRLASPMEKMVCIAKAMVQRFGPIKSTSTLIKRLLKD